MPAEMTGAELSDALAVIEEWDVDSARAVRTALESIGWSDTGSLLIRLYDIQLFVWYTLPRKFMTDSGHKRAVAEALARVLAQLGGRAAGYAAICRSPETGDLLQAWEDEDPGAGDQFRRLQDQSGLEPPNTPLLTWGKLTGFTEASARDQVVTALECAVDAGTLIPGARGFRQLQAQIAEDALHKPVDGERGETRLEAIHAERLADWCARGIARGGEYRRAILDPIASLLDGPLPKIDPEAARAAIAPAIWLLELGVDGIATRDGIAADGGQAAVAVESGKPKAAGFRWACNKRLRDAFHVLADSTRHRHPWA